MTFKDYRFMETALQNAYNSLLNAYQICDTSYCEEPTEKKSDILEWNDDFNRVMEKLRTLREEMIFTFKIED